MAKLAIVHNRQPDSSWKPVGVVLGTRARLDFKFLPGQDGWQRWSESLAENAQPPYLDGTGQDPARGTWEDWIPWAVGAFSNGHDAWLTYIDDPEATVQANYERYVLGAKPTPLTAEPARATDEIPELGGFRKVRPA